MKYKKGSAWKRTHWDRWTFWRKVGHVLAVAASLITVTAMWGGAAYAALIYFGVLGFLMEARDAVLLALAHWLFD